MDFDSMKYAELQSIAKELGLKANMKAEKLLKSIKQYYEQKEVGQEQNKPAAEVQEDRPVIQDSAQERKEASSKEASGTTVFVNTRRGRGNGTKRKISDTTTDAEIPPSAAEDDTKDAESCEPCDARGAKKRKVSSAKDSDPTEAEPLKNLQIIDKEQQQLDIKEVDTAVVNTEKPPKVAKAGRIPRYQGSQQKNKSLLKPITPNFKKLHEAHFNKMESIDSYVQRKTKQVETYKNSTKELKRVNVSRTSMFSPAPVSKKAAENGRRHTLLSASKAPTSKPAVRDVAPFRPEVLSTRRINVRFSEAVHDNEYKKSMVKTPARKSPCVTLSTPKTQQAAEEGKPSVKTSVLSASRTSAPFVFTGNTSTTPGTQKKASFDLKASLSRPLTYKPHTGKLKPFGETNENAAGNKSLLLNSHQKNYKQHQVQTRVDRRTKHVEERKQKKESMLGARRGLVMM